MNIVDKRDVALEMRKAKKKYYDEQFTLSVKDDSKNEGLIKLSASVKDNKVRLLDEGFIVDSMGEPVFYLPKGTCKQFYENLSEDFVGHYNLAHMEFRLNPILLGSWNKSDLTLVDTENGRQALDIEVHLNEDLNIVQDLKKMDFDLCVSAELDCKMNWDMYDEIGYPVYDKIDIRGIAIVGNPGNVNSSGLKLNVEDKMEDNKIVEPVVEEAGDDTMTEVLNVVKGLTEQVKSLKEELASLKEENATLNETLSAKEEKEKNFFEKFKMSVGELAPKQEHIEEKHTAPSYTDGLC